MAKKIKNKLLPTLLAFLSLCSGVVASAALTIPAELSLYYDTPLSQSAFVSLTQTESDCVPCGAHAPVQERQAVAKLFGVLPLKTVSLYYYEQIRLVPAGTPFGVLVDVAGVCVAEIHPFQSGGAEVSPAMDAGICTGDLVTSFDGVPLQNAASFTALLDAGKGTPVTLGVLRDGEALTVTLSPRRDDEDGKWRAGILARDKMSGIGTMTYYDPETHAFGGLGHGICDIGSDKLLPVSGGEIYDAELHGVQKGERGIPGELKGGFGAHHIGTLRQNSECGVFGTLDKAIAGESEALPIGLKSELSLGAAEIVATVDGGERARYAVEITRICDAESATKNFLVTVTDEALIEKTGGIVQGMSGSPILQNGKIVGALTHVLVNHPTKGYGIYLENMLRAAA